jgi:HAD superfamily hydrolase (TIGR01509 family)
MTNFDLVIFDCDGVLIDSEPIASSTLAHTLRRQGIAITAEEAHLRFTGYSESAIRRMCVDDLGLTEVEAVFTAWHADVYAAFKQSLRAMPGMPAVVNEIAVPKCVASNSTLERLRNSLGVLELWDAFVPHVFSAEQVASPKPAPDLLLYCAAQFGAGAGRCIMIDDSPHGVEAALAAGMLAIGFVDPADIRPDRAKVLEAAGAHAVVQGAAELAKALGHLMRPALAAASTP